MTEISWPVFQLTNKIPQTESGVTFYVTESYNRDTATYTERIKVIDDKNLPGDTLSRRRLQLQQTTDQIYKIKRAIYFVGDFIKLATPKMWFIDSSGTVFQYKKTTRAKLRFYKVKAVFPVNGIGAVIEVEGLPQRFKVLYRPVSTNKWAGILEFSGIKFLYGLYDMSYPDTWRLV